MDQKTVMASGVAAIQGENIAGARQMAIQDALRQAVEQGVGMLMDAKAILKNDELMERIYTNTQGYITGYDVLKEKREPNGLYRVTVEASVRTGAIRDDLVRLGVLTAMMDYPRLMILAHPGVEYSPDSRPVETVFIKHLTDKHFDIVDPEKSRELHDEAKALLKADSPENLAARIGLKHQAELVILYRVQAGRSQSDGITEQADAKVETKAIVTTTAQVLTADEKSVTGVGKNPSFARQDGARKAAEMLADPVTNAILSWWADYTANGLPYVVTLQTPLKSDRLIIDFQKSIESIPGVVALAERSSGGGVTEMMVKYKGSSADLKRAIFEGVGSRSGFKNLNTVASKGRFLVLSVK